MSKFRDQLKKKAEAHWDKAREAETKVGGDIQVPCAENYTGVQTWETGVIKSGKNAGAPRLIETITVDEGDYEGRIVRKRYDFSSQTYKDNDGKEVSQSQNSFEALAKRLKQSYPAQKDQISEMDADDILDFIDDILEDEHPVTFKVDEFKGGQGDMIKFFQVTGTLEVEDEVEEADEEAQADVEESDEEEEEGDVAIEADDTVMYTPDGAKRGVKCLVEDVDYDDETATLKSVKGDKVYGDVPLDALTLLDV